MPKKVLPSAPEFESFKRKLLTRGFRPISGHEFGKQFGRLGLKAPRPRYGRESGFIFYANELCVVVWTTWLAKEGVARDADSGWALITDRDKALYFARPLMRTKNFLRSLLWEAYLAAWRVEHRPLCPECKQYMNIVRGKGIKSRYWRCGRRSLHEGGAQHRLSWDHGLPEKALEYVRKKRRAQARYLKKVREEEKQPFAALLRRKPWIRSRVTA